MPNTTGAARRGRKTEPNATRVADIVDRCGRGGRGGACRIETDGQTVMLSTEAHSAERLDEIQRALLADVAEFAPRWTVDPVSERYDGGDGVLCQWWRASRI